MCLNSGWTYDRQIMYDENNFTADAGTPNCFGYKLKKLQELKRVTSC